MTRRNPRYGLGLRLIWTESLSLLAVLVGAALRLHQISYQIVADDEWHGLQTALYGSYASVLTHFGSNDYCIPLTAFYKLMSETLGLSELVMRAPVLLSGLAALVVFPLLVRPWVGKPASVLFAWLLAIAPLHVYFSRYARPYSITLFLAFLGIASFYRWWQSGGRRWFVTYAGCAVVAIYVHLIVAPFVLAPLAWALAEVCLGKARDQRASALRRLVTLGAVVTLGLVILLAVPLWSDWHTVTWKLSGRGVTKVTIVHAIELLMGTRQWWLIALLGAAMLTGLAVMQRTQARLVGYLVFLSAAQTLPSLVGQPAYIDVPITLARYNLTLLPIVLVFVAVGLTRLGQALPRIPVNSAVAIPGAVACALLLYFGPLAEIYYRPNNWTNHGMFQYAYARDTLWAYGFLKPPEVSAFYHQLARLPRESVRIVEAPSYYEWQKNAYPNYQRLHGQRMFVGMVDDVRPAPRVGELPLARQGLHFSNFIHVADHVGLLRRGITFVVFHKDFASEVPGATFERVDVKRWVEHYRRVYGAPSYEDRHLVVFDVTRRGPSWPS